MTNTLFLSKNTFSLWMRQLTLLFFVVACQSVNAQTPLADRPVQSGSVNGNVALALSVEYPTGITPSYKYDNTSERQYSKNNTYLGYFDSEKCYAYPKRGDRQVYAGLYSTGVDNNGRLLSTYYADDSHWTVTSHPRCYFCSRDISRLNDTSRSYSTATALHIGYGAGNMPVGDYTYQSNAFNLPWSENPADIQLQFEVLTDDQLVSILVNGVAKPYNLTNWPSENVPATVTFPPGTFWTYWNQITIVVRNVADYRWRDEDKVGLRVDKVKFIVKSNATNEHGDYFKPVAAASAHSCQNVSNGRWSGNFLNWSLTQVIDPLRQTLTGGNRDVDEANKTILVKAYASGEDPNLVRDHELYDSNEIKAATPFDNWTYLRLKTHGLGTYFHVTSSANINSTNTSDFIDGAHAGDNPNPYKIYKFNGRVEACVPGMLEDNCHAYPSGHYKPTGLIQKNAEKLRFSAFGYLYDGNNQRDGGVLRARMASVGPGGDYPEWDENTGVFLKNPQTADAANSGVANSGVINYLNKFGYSAPGYKGFDPVSELYYSVGRYFRNKGDVPEYSNLPSDAATAEKQKDGFPVITNWSDPIRFSCEANFIVGVGDNRTHSDANLPGSTIATSNEPARPAAVKNDYGSLTDPDNHFTDVFTSTQRVGDLEGITGLGTARPSWCCGGNSYFISGLAYDLHTRDFRPDLPGKQTISTYWLDVLEAGFNPQNQYWLAAKYGGFDVPDEYDPYGTLSPLNRLQWDLNNDADPDHYFRASDPANMKKSLDKAFDSILSEIDKVSTGFALASPNVATGDKSFGASYKTGEWTGSVSGHTLSFDGNGNPVETEAWNTNTTFEAQVSGDGWSNKRNIITANCSSPDSDGEQSCSAVRFRSRQLNSDNKNALDKVDVYTGVSGETLNYLRGDKTLEGKYRIRKKILGDIVNSKVAPVGPPNAPYSDAFNPGYSAFKSAYQSRSTIAYVGANDGMLHAFDGATGKERFAYVPEAVFNGPDNTPQENGLVALAYTNYRHRFYVDASPSFFDINFGASDWHTVLFSGLGKGGRSYFALDVTNPDAVTRERNATSTFLWEFTHKDLGFTFGRPISVKVDGKWVVIFTSGYNNRDGKGYFFVVDPKTGTLINKVSTGVGSTNNDAGLAHLTAFIANKQDFSADAAYAGDLLGNVWRLDLSGISTPGYAKAPTLIATLTSSDGKPQPITTSPVVEYDLAKKKRIVFVGTGRLLHQTDLPIKQVQTLYAINDGDQSAFYTSDTNDANGTLPSGASGFPITRALLIDHTDNPNSIVENANKPMGYFIDMESGYYIDRPMVSAAGSIAILANKIIGDSCDVDSVFRGYVLNYASGKSLITNTNTGITTQYIQGKGMANSITIYQNPTTGRLNVNISHEDEANGGNTSLEISNSNVKNKTLNWRLVPIE